MCGIVGFTGRQQAAPILLNGLSKLEYRGYDSAGIAVRDGEHPAQVVKAKGRLSNLVEKTDEGKALLGTCGIGHTRWATHGEPSQINAHPHVSGNCSRSGSGEVESEVAYRSSVPDSTRSIWPWLSTLASYSCLIRSPEFEIIRSRASN